MSRTDRRSAPWAIRGTRRGLPVDARSGRIATDASTVAVLAHQNRGTRRDSTAETAEIGV